jgi:hypothetical protein
MTILDFESLIQIGVIGIFTGFGSALGNYLAQRSFIRHLEKIGLKDKK